MLTGHATGPMTSGGWHGNRLSYINHCPTIDMHKIVAEHYYRIPIVFCVDSLLKDLACVVVRDSQSVMADVYVIGGMMCSVIKKHLKIVVLGLVKDRNII